MLLIMFTLDGEFSYGLFFRIVSKSGRGFIPTSHRLGGLPVDTAEEGRANAAADAAESFWYPPPPPPPLPPSPRAPNLLHNELGLADPGLWGSIFFFFFFLLCPEGGANVSR